MTIPIDQIANQRHTPAKRPRHGCFGRRPNERESEQRLWRPLSVPKTKKRRRSPKSVLRIPDLAHSKSAVLNSLGSESSHPTYDYAIDRFVEWYCSEPRLAFNRTVVLRYRIHLEQLRYAPSTINLHLAAVRRLAFEAADTGLLSPELAAGIARVKGVKRLGVRMGNWLSATQGKSLVDCHPTDSARGLRNRAMVSVLIGCGLRRAELLNLRFEDLQFGRSTGSSRT